MNRNRERELFEEYRADLLDAEKRRDEADADIAELRPIVTNMEARLRRRGLLDKPEPEPEPDLEPLAPPEAADMPKAKRRGVKRVIADLMTDGQRRDADAVLEALNEDPRFAGDLPARQTVNNRLFDLEKENFLRRVETGVYELASHEAQRNAELPGVQTQDPTVRQKPPAEDDARPQPGQPLNGAGG